MIVRVQSVVSVHGDIICDDRAGQIHIVGFNTDVKALCFQVVHHDLLNFVSDTFSDRQIAESQVPGTLDFKIL